MNGRGDRRLGLVVLDGWGVVEHDTAGGRGDALGNAETPFLDALTAGGRALLRASGDAVGLPVDQPGNSQAGHTTIGAGRVVSQDLVRIDGMIARGELDNGAIGTAFRRAGATNRAVHLVGMVSSGGVHSHIRHATALLELAARYRMRDRTFLHAVTDGRDVAARSGEVDLPYLERTGARIASVSGRVYAMDRSGRTERIAAAVEAMTGHAAVRASCAVDALHRAYRAGRTDQDVEPTVVGGCPVRPGDEVVFFNFRPDGLRELCRAITTLGYRCTTLTRYLPAAAAVAVMPPEVSEPLGAVVAARGLRQVRIAESEKFGHVTYFLDGYRDIGAIGYQAIRVPSRTDVHSYAECPQMSAAAVTDATVAAWKRGAEFVVTNLANADSVGHTGDLTAVRVAARTVDRCVRVLARAAREHGVTLLVTADHGNAEQMLDESGPDTRHTRNRVPCWLVGPARSVRRSGGLADIAPTCLELLGLPVPAVMSGTSLLRPTADPEADTRAAMRQDDQRQPTQR